MSDYEEGSRLIEAGIIALHDAGHGNIETLLRMLAKKYKQNGVEIFAVPDEPEPNAWENKIIVVDFQSKSRL